MILPYYIAGKKLKSIKEKDAAAGEAAISKAKSFSKAAQLKKQIAKTLVKRTVLLAKI